MTAPNPGAFLNSLSSAERKEVAMSRGLLAYFPDALALVARHSVRANEKHNPGEPVRWSREKSSDHEDCIVRHSASIAVDPNSLDDGQPHIVCRAWRSLAALQLWAEAQVPSPATDDYKWVKLDVTSGAPGNATAATPDTSALGEGWLPNPGFPPRTVLPYTAVEVILRSGKRSAGRLCDFDWRATNAPSGIVAYKPVGK